MVSGNTSRIEAALEHDGIRTVVGLAIAILGTWAFATTFRAWAYADHWAEPLVIGFCFFVLAWTPFLGIGLIFGYQKTTDPRTSRMAAEVAEILKEAGWNGTSVNGRIRLTSPDGRSASISVETEEGSR